MEERVQDPRGRNITLNIVLNIVIRSKSTILSTELSTMLEYPQFKSRFEVLDCNELDGQYLVVVSMGPGGKN